MDLPGTEPVWPHPGLLRPKMKRLNLTGHSLAKPRMLA